ncbi:MAG: hypothetical protein ACM3N5_04080 [Candidatus Eiseniibacteriota bacterium]
MTIAPRNDDKHDNPGVPSAPLDGAAKGLIAQLLSYLIGWRRRQAARTIARHADLIGQPADLYRVYEAEIARSTSPAAADREGVLRRDLAVRDFA